MQVQGARLPLSLYPLISAYFMLACGAHYPFCKNRSKPAPDFGRKRQVISAESGT
jgi:hypothetical protein